MSCYFLIRDPLTGRVSQSGKQFPRILPGSEVPVDSKSAILRGLNPSQQEAVTATGGSLLIVAGPGTGKTLTLVRRIAYLINQGVDPAGIVAVTFTNRAAREMRERIAAFLGPDAPPFFIGTLHMLGLTILREHAPQGFSLYTRDDQVNLLKEILHVSGVKAGQFAERISRMKNSCEEGEGDVKAACEQYEAALTERHGFDLDDLILKPIGIMSRPGPPDQHKSAYEHVIVDEYQDINPAQYKLLRLLAGDTGNICAVGDPDQAIYAFRGADVSNFLNFEKDFPGPQKVVLSHNYRSTPIILAAASAMVRCNTRRIDKDISPVRSRGRHITVVSVPDERAEGRFVVNEIEARLGGTSLDHLVSAASKGDLLDSAYSFSDFAVMYRTNAQAALIEEAFQVSGIPYQVVGARNKAQKIGLNRIIALLRERALEMGDSQQQCLSLENLLGMVLEEVRGDAESGLVDMVREYASVYVSIHPPGTPMGFIDELSLLTPVDSLDPRADAVTLMTLHMAKGLEFRVVFIAGLEDGLIPHLVGGMCEDMEEERRLFYVGMTRAKDDLFLMHARNRYMHGKGVIPIPSRFLEEIPAEFLEHQFMPDRARKARDQQMELF